MNVYNIQSKVLVEVQLILKLHPTGRVEQQIQVNGGLLPSGLHTTKTWTQRHAPSSLFEICYTFLFFAALYLRYVDYKSSTSTFHIWIGSNGNLLSLITTLLTLVIVVYDIVVARPSLTHVVSSILQSTSHTFLSESEQYLTAIQTEMELFSIQLLFFCVPLLLSVRMLPHVGPNIVALINAVVNWTVG